MCPACMTTLAMVTAAVTSTGGVIAMVATRLGSTNARTKERDVEKLKTDLRMNTPPVVSPQEWETARQQLLVKEKAVTHARDSLAAERRRMPWVAVDKG